LELQVFDTTLRDGSNAISTGYSDDDVRRIVGGLSASGISWIEVGHGVAIGLSDSDARVCALARSSSATAQIGAVLVPVLTPTGALESVLQHLDFIRLAPGPGMLEGCIPFVRTLRRNGRKAFLQLVKTHTYPRDTLVDSVRPLVDEGLHALYVVDTAGCMLPEDVRRYVSLLRESLSIPIGFHGHNNSSLAMVNSMAAVDAGAAFVDGTLGGIGRGAGNTQIELFVHWMQVRGLCRGIALDRLFELSYHLWNRFPNAARGVDPVEAYYAVHGWDSLSRDAALEAAADLGVSPFAVIKSLTERASPPWISPADIQETITRLRGAGTARSSGAAVADTRAK
jgi:4-hydroxy 2-oxovalerate aldolase